MASSAWKKWDNASQLAGIHQLKPCSVLRSWSLLLLQMNAVLSVLSGSA